IRDSDVVIAISRGSVDLGWAGRERALRGCELIIVEQRASDSLPMAVRPREVQVVGDRSRLGDALAATGPRSAGRAPGIALSGGGARAFAHLGALEELCKGGIRFDRVGGVSLGALVGGFVAMDVDPADIYEVFRRGFVETNPTNDFALPAFSLVRGGKTRRLMRDAFGERRIEELPRRFFCLS